MRFTIAIVFCFSLIVSSSWAQSTSSMPNSGSSGPSIDSLLHPLRPFLGETGHKALHAAIEGIPKSVLSRISNLGQLFGSLMTFNPSSIPSLFNQIFPNASSMLSSILPSLGYSPSAPVSRSGLEPSTSTRSGFSSSPSESQFRRNSPTSQRENRGSSNSPSNQRFNSFNQDYSPSDSTGRFSNLATSGYDRTPEMEDEIDRLSSLYGPYSGSSGPTVSNRPGSQRESEREREPEREPEREREIRRESRRESRRENRRESSRESDRERRSMFSSPFTNLLSNSPFAPFLSG